MLEVALTDAGTCLPDLVRRAEAGEDVVLTRDGHAAVRLTLVPKGPAKPTDADETELTRLLDALQAEARRRSSPGPSAARSQDFLYDEYGLPA